MTHIPVLRWGEPYKSWRPTRSSTSPPASRSPKSAGPTAAWSSATCATPSAARDVLREIPITDLLQMIKKAADLYTKAELPLGDGTQTPDEFARMQSATTGLPEHMCRFNMQKNHFVLNHMDEDARLADARPGPRHPVARLRRGSRGVPVSYQAQSPVLGLVLPSNSPGVHTLWLPVIPMQIGLVLKPGPQEPWTPYRMAQAFVEAGMPAGHLDLSRLRRRRRGRAGNTARAA